MPKPDPVYVRSEAARSASATIDPTLRSYWPTTVRLTAAMLLASDVEGLRLVLATTIADRYAFQVADDGSEVRLRRRA